MEQVRIRDRFQHAWNAFLNKDPTPFKYANSSMHRPDRNRPRTSTERSMAISLYNRISLDAAALPIKHIRLDENERYVSTEQSTLNEALTLSANTDQTGRALIQDVVMSMFDEGVVAIVPVDTDYDPMATNSYSIYTLRVGKVLEWFPTTVRVSLYNEIKGMREDIMIPKSIAAIVENPLYSVMNEPNSVLRRLIDKLNLLDSIDKQSGSGKLDLIFQLPYTLKTPAKREQAENRRREIEDQLAGSKYGIAYTDGTEKVTQLNRPAENNLMGQIEYLTAMLYSQLGLSEAVFNGTANEQEMLNYYNRTIEPVLSAITDEMNRKFLTKTARTQGQKITFFRDPFKLVPVNQLADIADKFTRNEILSSNEVRAVVGYKPSKDKGADELRNKNLNPAEPATQDQNKIKGDPNNEKV